MARPTIQSRHLSVQAERDRTRHKGNHYSLGSLTDLRLSVTFEPFPTHKNKERTESGKSEAHIKRSTERGAQLPTVRA